MVDTSAIPGMTGETGYLLPREGRSLHDAFDMDDPTIVKFGAVYTKENFIRELIITKRRKSTLGVKGPSGYEAMMIDQQVDVNVGSQLPDTLLMKIPSQNQPKMVSPIIEYRDFNARLHDGITGRGWDDAVDWVRIEENRLLERGYSLLLQYEDPSPKKEEIDQDTIDEGEAERVSFGTLMYGAAAPSEGVMNAYGMWVEGIASGFAVVILPMFVFGVAMGSCIWVVNWGLRRIGGE